MITALTSPSIASTNSTDYYQRRGILLHLINMNAFIVGSVLSSWRLLSIGRAPILRVAITIALGGVCTLISNTCYQRLISRYKRPYLNHWESTLITAISTTNVHLSKPLINRLNSTITSNKNEHLKLSIDHQNIIERINITLTKYQALVTKTTLTTPQIKH